LTPQVSRTPASLDVKCQNVCCDTILTPQVSRKPAPLGAKCQ